MTDEMLIKLIYNATVKRCSYRRRPSLSYDINPKVIKLNPIGMFV